MNNTVARPHPPPPQPPQPRPPPPAPQAPQPPPPPPPVNAVLQVAVYDPVSGQWYYPGQTLQFYTPDDLYAFLQSVPQCVQTDVPYPYVGVSAVYVSAGYGCLPVNTSCPCATYPLLY